MYKYSLLLLFVFLEIIIYLLMSLDKKYRIENRLEQDLVAYSRQYESIYASLKKHSRLIFDEVIDQPNVTGRLERSSYVSKEEQNSIRKSLYLYLRPSYDRLKSIKIRSLQFHTPDNHSFLRLHMPDRFGDDLTQVRPTVVYVNETHKEIDSFEEGRAFSGYRFVYPLFGTNDIYLGSVEISLDPTAISSLMQEYKFDAHILIKKSVIERKAWTKDKEEYAESEYNPLYVVSKLESKETNRSVRLQKLSDSRLEIETKMGAGNAFAIYGFNDNRAYSTTFLPITNKITQETVAYFTLSSKNGYIDEGRINFWIVFAVMSILNLTVMFFMFRIKKSESALKQNIAEIDGFSSTLDQANKQLNAIIDGVDNMLLVMKGDTVLIANSKYLEYTGLKENEVVNAQKSLFEDYLVLNDEVKSIMNSIRPYSTLGFFVEVERKDYILVLQDNKGVKHSFAVNLKEYDTNRFVVTFTNVSTLIDEKNQFEYKANHDHLTGIYNRQYFMEMLNANMGRLSRIEDQVCLVMIDMDHFKHVNDTYGHDVGDKVLKEFTRIVSENLRKDDLFSRWGGEEFMVLLPHTTLKNAVEKMDQLRVVLNTFNNDTIPSFTASFGVTQMHSYDTVESVLKRVDEALYAAKQAGRDRVQIL